MIRKLVAFFIGLLILLLTGASLLVAGYIYDTGKTIGRDVFFFQPDDLSSQRVGVPVDPTKISDDKMIELLISKYISEYFYAIPDSENIALRMRGDSVLSKLSSASVFEIWQDTQGAVIENMADASQMRAAFVVGVPTPPNGENNYWTVDYQLKTWTAPNHFEIEPVLESGKLYMEIRYVPGVRPSIAEIGIKKYLDSGADPVTLFMFSVDSIIGAQI